MTSKDKVRVLRFKIQKSDVEKLLKLHAVLKKMDMEDVIALISTKIQNYLKKMGYVISNLVKNEGGN